jgi:DNA-binding GntR family transcriptional regulator
MTDLGGGTTAGLPSLRGRRNLREEITATLRGAVISGELQPGVVYSAPSLAEQFGVSPTPVREAMLDLTKEGLVQVARNKGFRVTQLSPAELDNITEIRALLEVPAIRKITETGADPAVIKSLRPLAVAIEDAARRSDFIAHVAIDMEFHLALLELTGNPRLVDIVRSLRTSSRLYGLKTLTVGSALLDSSHEHAELLDLIEAGDADGAANLMRRHIGHVRGIWAAKDAAAGDVGHFQHPARASSVSR